MNMKGSRALSFFLAMVLIVSAFSVVETKVSADDTVAGNSDSLNANESSQYANNSIELPLKTATAENADITLDSDSLIWNNGSGNINFTVEIPESALYNIKIVWQPLDTGTNVELGFKIDGEYPSPGMETVILSRHWKNATQKPTVDSLGNEYAQEQVQTEGFLTETLQDKTGIEVDPYLIKLEKGVHTVTLEEPNQSIEIKNIILCPPEKTVAYSEISKDYDIAESDAVVITLQGEAADEKSSNSIIPKSDNSNAGMTPSDYYNQKINCIGGTSWQSPGSKLTWNFEVEETGYYRIVVRYKQSDLINGNSLRWLKIDGETPFTEAKEISFPYSTGWEYFDFSDENGKAYYIPLEKGPHTLSLEATVGSQYVYIERLSEIVERLSDEYIKIVMITGETPDINMDYELFNQISDFEKNLIECRDELDKLALDMKNLVGKNTTQCISSMENMSRVLNNMIRNRYIAQQYLSDYYSNYTSLSSWLNDMTNMPLYLDEIQLVPAGKDFENKSVGFFSSLWFGFKKFLASFNDDYQVDEKSAEDSEIRLWVNWGQDQAASLNSIIQDSFTATTGINVQLEIVNASLVNGILSGNFPDVALQMARTEPVNLGMRGALADLTQFDDYKEVLSRFQPGAEEPYLYNGSLYALPDTQEFMIMYYRNDILESLELKVPETWEEFKYAATIIQRNNMNVYIPYTQMVSTATVNTGIGSLHILPTLLSQNNLSIYNEAKNATALATDEVIEVIKEWTDLYKNYDILEEADFYNRMRLGSMPLGIAPYSTYMTLYSAAPEIKGRWSIALVPGTYNEDGKLNRSVAGSGTGCAIIEKSENKEAAWEFLKWWTSAEAQTRYNNSVESILGTVGRIRTSNIGAFNSMAWDKDDLNILNQQWAQVKEVPEVPGSYYLARSVDQIFWSVVNGESNVKNAAVKWGSVADTEIERKIRQYS